MVEAVFELSRARGFAVGWSSELLHYFISARVSHVYKQSIYTKINTGSSLLIKSKVLGLFVYYKFKMSTRAMTLSMQSLNKLYVQFLQKYVVPNLVKPIQQISQLFKQKTAYEVHRYLEEIFSSQADNLSTVTNHSSVNSVHSGSGSGSQLNNYQYALPTQSEHHKNVYTDNSQAFDRSLQKSVEENVTFKNKMGLRRALTGLAYEQQPRTFEFKATIDDNQMSLHSLNSSTGNDNHFAMPPTLSPAKNSDYSDFKLEFGSSSKESMSKIPVLGRASSEQQNRGRLMKQQVKRIMKVFNEGHSKIEKYNKNGVQNQNKIFNLNVSTKLEKKDEGGRFKDYQFQMKQEGLSRKF